MQGAETKAVAAEEKEQSLNEPLSQSLSRITVLDIQVRGSTFFAKQKLLVREVIIFTLIWGHMQIANLRTEQTQVSPSLEEERQIESGSRQKNLSIKKELAMQEGRAKQLEEEIKELRASHKKELQAVAEHSELLEKVFGLLREPFQENIL